MLLNTLDYFVKSLSNFSVDSLAPQMSGSIVFSPREREQLDRFVGSFAITWLDICCIMCLLFAHDIE